MVRDREATFSCSSFSANPSDWTSSTSADDSLSTAETDLDELIFTFAKKQSGCMDSLSPGSALDHLVTSATLITVLKDDDVTGDWMRMLAKTHPAVVRHREIAV